MYTIETKTDVCRTTVETLMFKVYIKNKFKLCDMTVKIQNKLYEASIIINK